MERLVCIILVFLFVQKISFAQVATYQKMANTAMEITISDARFLTNKGYKWTYDLGVPLEGLLMSWRASGNAEYYAFVKKWMDKYIDKEGAILNYSPDEFNIDHVKNGKVLLSLFKITNDKRYLEACHKLFAQMQQHPRTNEGGFWHKKIYPNQMWLDGLYMAQPFLAEYADLLGLQHLYTDIANQFIWMEKNAKDKKTGLLYHGWDESRKERWSDSKTGLSPHFWARGMGWFVMALVDVLDYFPEDHAGHKKLIDILNRTIAAVAKYQDHKTGVWYDIVDLANREGNYVEASASSMFVYAMAKGVRKGYLPKKYALNIEKGHQGLLNEFITEVNADKVDLNKVVAVSGLGGSKNYRDGSFEYYMSEPVVSNDPKGVGPFMLADIEYRWLKQRQNKTVNVVLDNYYNNEFKEVVTGKSVPYHYLWDGQDNNGFYGLGLLFESFGGKNSTLKEAPTAKNLKTKDIYIIVDPDTEKETANPNFMSLIQAKVIANWVKKGGVLVLLLNDFGNCDLDKINLLSSQFGIQFNHDSKNTVQGRNYEQGAVNVHPNDIFKKSSKLYLKEISTINVSKSAKSLLTHNNETIMAVSSYGKGTVFAVGDPWLYNEYVDGRKLPQDFENFTAANELVQWLFTKVK